jgi:hypothetical protein
MLNTIESDRLIIVIIITIIIWLIDNLSIIETHLDNETKGIYFFLNQNTFYE